MSLIGQRQDSIFLSFYNFLSRSFVIFRLSLQFCFCVFAKFVIVLKHIEMWEGKNKKEDLVRRKKKKKKRRRR